MWAWCGAWGVVGGVGGVGVTYACFDMIPLKDAIDRVAADNAPCLVIACGLGYATPDGTMSNILAARSETPDTGLDELVTALAGLKQTYLKMCEGYASSAGLATEELLRRIDERAAESPLRD